VVEHWTSDGLHFHFRYDFKARISWATDVLGRELEVQYNADHRVFASRDYGGERSPGGRDRCAEPDHHAGAQTGRQMVTSR